MQYNTFVKVTLVLVTFAIRNVDTNMALRKARQLAPQLFMKAPDRIRKEGYPVETHKVQTEDGYILGLHRIPSPIHSTPVFFHHGQSSMSDSWIVFGRTRSLAYQLADRGYDIWLGNARGNLYSRNHTTLKPSSSSFWKFSWHEMGIYDLPATIDYILKLTGHEQLYYIGHSMGGTAVTVLLSTKPEYNAKIRLVVGLAPGVFYKHMASRTTLSGVQNFGLLKGFLDVTKMYELLPYSEERIAGVYYLCRNGTLAQACENLISETFGKSDDLRKGDIPLLAASGMGGVSMFTTAHYVQLIKSGKFEQFDYGEEENMRRYSHSKPPEYDLNKITAPVVIHYGDTDALVSSEDSVHLSNVLPNVVEARRVPRKLFNHLDFISHTKVKGLLYDHVIRTMEQF